MNFEKALELLKQGKKVRKRCWANSEKLYVYLENNEFWLATGKIAGTIGIHYDDMLADDWEEYKEPLLTEEEKEYLRMIIKFTPGNIKIVILGRHFVGCNYIYLHYSNDDMINSYSHCVSKGLFKNLEGYKSYTLEELGLDEA